MNSFPEKITHEEELEEILSRPSREVIELMTRLKGNLLLLYVAGKIGISLAQMAKRACMMAGVEKRIIGVSRFSNPEEKESIEGFGIETISVVWLDRRIPERLPRVKNVLFMAGMKFGTQENSLYTWAMNSCLPAMVADYFHKARIVALSTGCVYPLVQVKSGSFRESEDPLPVGEYAQSCLGRERMFELGSHRHKNPAAIIRLNYAVETTYPHLYDDEFVAENLPRWMA